MNHTHTYRLSAWVQKATAFAVFSLFGLTLFTASADARLIFTTEGDGNLVDEDLDGDGNYSLFFGSALEAEIEFDTTNDRFNIAKDVNITGDATTSGDVNVGTNLEVIGTSDLQGDVSNTTGTLTFADDTNTTGAADFDTTVNVDGATTLQDTLDVTGATVLQSTLNTQGAADFDTTVNVDGATTLQDTLDVTGATVLESTLNTQGAADFDSTLNVDGTSTFNDDVTLANNSEIINLRAHNSTTLAGAICLATSLGQIYYNTDTEDLLYCKETAPASGVFAWTSVTSGAATDVSTTFYAEFESFTAWADGTTNRGTLKAEYDETDDRSYYVWSTRNGSQQDYDVVLQWQVPDNFSEFKTSVTDHLQFDIETAGANSKVDLRDVQVNGADASIADLANTAATWTTQDVDLSGATVAAGDKITFRFTLYGQSGGSTSSLSNVKINYTQQ